MNFVCNWLPFWLPLPFVLGIMLAGFLWPIVDLRPAMLKNIPRGISEVMKTWPLGDGEKPNFLRKPLSWQIMRPKGFHLLMFFLWSFLLFGALESVAGLPWWLAGLVALALSVGLGFFTEVAQASTGKRGGDSNGCRDQCLGLDFGCSRIPCLHLLREALPPKSVDNMSVAAYRWFV